jgi:acetate---CoA ligase (ADP-forming)
MAERAEWLRRPAGRVRRFPADRTAVRDVVRAALAGGEGAWLDPAAAEHVLSVYGISSAAQRIVEDGDAARAAAAGLGYPVAVKTSASGVHKTERGGVVLDVRSPQMLEAALSRVGFPALLQRMVPGGVEVMAGALQDPVFGPVVAFGIGGTMAELLEEVRFAPAPVSDVDADELLSSGKTGRLIAGLRGAAPVDAAALRDLVERLAQLAADVPEIAEVDLNPVIALRHGCVVVDARIRVSRSVRTGAAKTW